MNNTMDANQIKTLVSQCNVQPIGRSFYTRVYKGEIRGTDVAIKAILKVDLAEKRPEDFLRNSSEKNVLQLLHVEEQLPHR